MSEDVALQVALTIARDEGWLDPEAADALRDDARNSRLLHALAEQELAATRRERDRALAQRAADPDGLIAERRELLVEVEELRVERDAMRAVVEAAKVWTEAQRLLFAIKPDLPVSEPTRDLLSALDAYEAGPSTVGCPDCGSILNAKTANCPGAWHYDNQPATERLFEQRDQAITERDELRALFDLQWTRMGEATALWRAESPAERDLVMPDLGDLLNWLLHRNDAVVEAAPRPRTQTGDLIMRGGTS